MRPLDLVPESNIRTRLVHPDFAKDLAFATFAFRPTSNAAYGASPHCYELSQKRGAPEESALHEGMMSFVGVRAGLFAEDEAGSRLLIHKLDPGLSPIRSKLVTAPWRACHLDVTRCE